MKGMKIREIFEEEELKDEKIFMMCIEGNNIDQFNDGDILLLSKDFTKGNKVLLNDHTVVQYNNQINVLGKIIAVHNGIIVEEA